MSKYMMQSVLAVLMLFVLGGCASRGVGELSLNRLELDRQAILGMAGTFAVSFDFEETLALREGYELHEPYHQAAEELVVVIEDRGDFISLQHLLVVRFDGETQVINHWRQDWQYEGAWAYTYASENTYSPVTFSADSRDGAWVQSVYNVADSPRYANIGRWTHRAGASTWTGSAVLRPLPLREFHMREVYNYLDSVNTLVVTDAGWLHYQTNTKLDTTADDPSDQALALERGMNRYERVPDEGFEEAHAYWANTSAYWKEVRGAWSRVLAGRQTITLRSQWMGESLFMHLFGLSDDYWGDTDASAAVPEIEEVIDAFLQPE